jgi:hypothetical protein
VDVGVRVDALHRQARLPRADEAADGALLGDLVEIRVGCDDDRSDAAQLEMDVLAGRRLLDRPADVAAREADDRQAGIADELHRLLVADGSTASASAGHPAATTSSPKARPARGTRGEA